MKVIRIPDEKELESLTTAYEIEKFTQGLQRQIDSLEEIKKKAMAKAREMSCLTGK